MDIDHDEQHGRSSPGMSLDVKLAFNRVCSLIDSLKNDVGPEAAAYQKKRIRNDLEKVLKIEKQRKLMKINEFHNASVFKTTAASARNQHQETSIQFPVDHQYNSVRLGTIIDEKETFRVDMDSSDSEEQEKESSEEDSYFFLRDWSILKKDNNLVLTGIQIDKRGEIIKRDFISMKILTRKDDNTVKTADGDFVLQGPLVDAENLIPAGVKAMLGNYEVFPRKWRKILQQWIDLDNRTSKGKDNVQRNKGKSPIEKKSTVKDNTKDKDNVQRNKGKSPIEKKSTVKDNTKGKDNVQRNKGKSPIEKKSTVKDNTKTKKSQEEPKIKARQKKNEKPAKSQEMCNGNKRDINDKGKDDRGPFSELLGDESLFLLPQSAMTPNGLLGSIKTNVIQGRYTPPTNVFDNVYGNKIDDNSSVNTSFDDLGAVAVNNHVVKRRVNAKVNPKKPTKKKNKITKPIIEENEAIQEILCAAKVKTNTTPSIIKQAFNTEEIERFSDCSSE